MKAICFADVHGDFDAVVKLEKSIAGEDLDYVFMLGDYSPGFKDEERNQADIKRILEILSGYRVRAIPGNCDHRSSVDIFNREGVNLHNTVLDLREAAIIGFGGSNPTPFDTPFEYSEEEIGRHLNNLYSKVEDGKKVIVMTHFPPKDTKCDVIEGGAHVGSTALKAFIEDMQPELVLCSHIHEAGGTEDRVGETRVLNLGRLGEGKAYVLTVSDSVDMEFYTG